MRTFLQWLLNLSPSPKPKAKPKVKRTKRTIKEVYNKR